MNAQQYTEYQQTVADFLRKNRRSIRRGAKKRRLQSPPPAPDRLDDTTMMEIEVSKTLPEPSNQKVKQ